MGFVKYSALCVMKCGLPNFDLGICYGFLYGSTLVIRDTYYIVKMDDPLVDFRVLWGQSKKGKLDTTEAYS